MSKAIEFLETRLGLDSNVSGKDRVDSNIIDIAEIMEDYADLVIKNGWIHAFKNDNNERCIDKGLKNHLNEIADTKEFKIPDNTTAMEGIHIGYDNDQLLTNDYKVKP